MNETNLKVWDIVVRVFHWSLVIAFTTAYLTGEEEITLHTNAGYAVLLLVVFRIIWGFVGSYHACFSNFVYSPAKVMSYLKSLITSVPQHYTGHNPAGGWVMLAMLASLILASVSGLKVYGLEGHGPLAGKQSTLSVISTARADADEYDDYEHDESDDMRHEDEESEEWWEEIHEFFANLTLLLIFIHVSGVLVSSLLHRENLVKAMLTGRKKAAEST